MSRSILHCDLNNFFASVECVRHPEWKDRPVAVCGSVKERHGICLAKNYPAKKYGIRTGDTVIDVLKKCPDAILAEPHYEEYEKYSRLTQAIYEEYTDRVEPFGCDESWLDVTNSYHLFGQSPAQVADMLRRMLNISGDEMPQFMDATDALGAAFCHYLQNGKPVSEKKYSSWADFVNKNPDKVK